MEKVNHTHAKISSFKLSFGKIIMIIIGILMIRYLIIPPFWTTYIEIMHIISGEFNKPTNFLNYSQALLFLILVNLPFLLIIWFTLKKIKQILFYIYNIFFPNSNIFSRKKKLSIDDSLGLQLNGKINIQNPYSGIFISGGAGSGKSKSLIEPIIYDAGIKNFTGVVYDFKYPELARYVETAFDSSKIEKKYVNFTDMNFTDRINPIEPGLMRNDSYAREFALSILANLNPTMISKPDFWSDNSLALLSAVFWYLKINEPQYCTLPHAMSLILQPDLEALLNMLQSNEKCSDMIATILTAHKQGAQNQLSGVISTLQVALSKINTAEIYFVTSESDFSLNLNDFNNKTILVVGNQPTLAKTYSPVIGLILTSISKQLNQQNKEKSIFLIDEFPTVFIPEVEQLPATGRSNKVATILACQDIAQMIDKYGKEKADTILSNLGNQFYGRTTNPDTAKRVSTLFGKSDKLMQSVNQSTSTEIFGTDRKKTRGSSYSYQERDLVKIQDVAQLNTGSFYTILSEGDIKQGKTTIPLNNSFVKSDLPQKRHITDEQIENVFTRVKMEAKQILSNYKL